MNNEEWMKPGALALVIGATNYPELIGSTITLTSYPETACLGELPVRIVHFEKIRTTNLDEVWKIRTRYIIPLEGPVGALEGEAKEKLVDIVEA